MLRRFLFRLQSLIGMLRFAAGKTFPGELLGHDRFSLQVLHDLVTTLFRNVLPKSRRKYTGNVIKRALWMLLPELINLLLFSHGKGCVRCAAVG